MTDTLPVLVTDTEKVSLTVAVSEAVELPLVDSVTDILLLSLADGDTDTVELLLTEGVADTDTDTDMVPVSLADGVAEGEVDSEVELLTERDCDGSVEGILETDAIASDGALLGAGRDEGLVVPSSSTSLFGAIKVDNRVFTTQSSPAKISP